MKRFNFLFTVFACILIFSSCGDNPIDDLFNVVDGKASSTVGDGEISEYSSSIVMFDTLTEHPSAVGLSLTTTLSEILNISSVDDLSFPMMVYRIQGKNFNSGDVLTVNNVLTDEDISDFDYKNLLDGKFAECNVVGLAVNDSVFYIMKSGNIDIEKSNSTKLKGSYSGTAYTIKITDGVVVLSDEIVDIKGNFSSRVTPIFSWIANL